MRFPNLILVASLCLCGQSVLCNGKLEREINDFFHDAEISSFRLSPGGEHVCYLETRENGSRALMTIDFSKGEKRGLEEAGGNRIFGIGWVGPNRLVYGESSRHGTRFEGLYSCKSLIHDALQLNSLDVLPRVIHYMPLDEMLCAAVDVRDKENHLQYLNVLTGEYSGRVKNPGDVVRYMLDTRGRVRIGLSKGEDQGKGVWLKYDPEGEEWSSMKIDRDVADWRFYDDGSVAFAEIVDGERVELQQYNLDTGEFVGRPIRSELVDVTVDGFLHDPATLSLFGIEINEPRPRIVWFDAGVAKLAKQLEGRFSGALVKLIGANSVNNDLYFVASSDVNPGSYFSVSQDGQITPIGNVNTKILGYELPRTEPIAFENRDGVTIHGYLTLPLNNDSKVFPLVVLVHGGPHSRDNWRYDAERQFLAYKGYATLTVNYRGSSGYGKSFWEQDGFVSILERSVNDVIDATRWTMSTYSIDAKRVSVMGGSFGGYAAMEAITREPKLYRCGVGFAGVYDWNRQLKESRSEGRSQWDWFLEEEFGDL